MSLRSAGMPAVAVLTLVLGGCALPGGDDGGSPSSPASVSGAATEPQGSSAVSPPASPPARICGSKGLEGPTQPPAGARRVTPSQDLAGMVAGAPEGATFWLTSGVHRLERGRYASVHPKDGQTFVGAPGAVIDGQNVNLYAFTGRATDVTIGHLTIRNFGTGAEQRRGRRQPRRGPDWRVQHITVAATTAPASSWATATSSLRTA